LSIKCWSLTLSCYLRAHRTVSLLRRR